MKLFIDLLNSLPFNPQELYVLLKTAPSRYKTHYIEKRHGRGKREISQPTAEVKLLQRWVIENVLSRLPVHDAATAYRNNIGIRDHASPHLKQNYLLKLDFKDFFPSILGVDFIKHVRRHLPDLTHDDARLLARILFRRDYGKRKLYLTIGAPSSPAVSNTIMYEFDCRLDDACRALGVTYTRYADDLALSTNNPRVLDNVLEIVKKLCAELDYPRLVLNEEKTVFTSRKHSRRLTGLYLTPDRKLSIGRDRKRLIRSMVFNYSAGILELDAVPKLRGLIAFAHSIEPEFLLTLERMIGAEAMRRLMKPDLD